MPIALSEWSAVVTFIVVRLTVRLRGRQNCHRRSGAKSEAVTMAAQLHSLSLYLSFKARTYSMPCSKA